MLLTLTATNRNPFKTQIELPSRLTNSYSIQGNIQPFWAHWATLMTKTDLTYPAFSLRFVEFAAQFSLCQYLFSLYVLHEWRKQQIL